MSLFNVNDIAITDLELVSVYKMNGDFWFEIDELQNLNIANTEEKEDIVGKKGRKLNSLKRNKAVVVTGTNGILSGGLFEVQTGGKLEEKPDAIVEWGESLVITDDKSNTRFKAVGTAGAEIKALFIKNSNGSLGTELTQGAAVGDGIFTYTPATKLLTFEADELTDGTEIYVKYKRAIQGTVLENLSDVSSEKGIMYIDAFGEDKCNNVYRIQFYIPKADFIGNFEIGMGDAQTVHNFEAESLATACGLGGSALWTYTIFGVNAPDAV